MVDPVKILWLGKLGQVRLRIDTLTYVKRLNFYYRQIQEMKKPNLLRLWSFEGDIAIPIDGAYGIHLR